MESASRYSIGLHATATATRAIAVNVRTGDVMATGDEKIIESLPAAHRIGVGVALAPGVDGAKRGFVIEASITTPESFAAVAGSGVAAPSTMVLWMSGGKIQPVLNSRVRAEIPGVRAAEDLILPGYIGYEPRAIPNDLSNIEATALELRAIAESIEDQGVPVRRFVVAGDQALASPALLQMFADVLGAKIKLAASDQPAALGAAILAAIAVGFKICGHASMSQLVHAMAHQRKDLVYRPDLVAKRKYART